MFTNGPKAEPRRDRRPWLSPIERRLACRMMDGDGELLRTLKTDPRTGPLARRLLRAYRAEMLADLRERLHAAADAATPRAAEERTDAREHPAHEIAASDSLRPSAAVRMQPTPTVTPGRPAPSDSHGRAPPRGPLVACAADGEGERPAWWRRFARRVRRRTAQPCPAG